MCTFSWQLSKILFLHQQHNSQRKLKSFSTVGSVLNEQLEHKRRRGRTKRLSTAGIQYLKVISLGRVAVNKPFLRKEGRKGWGIPNCSTTGLKINETGLGVMSHSDWNYGLYVWRRLGERWNSECLYGGGSVIVWVSISATAVGDPDKPINAEKCHQTLIHHGKTSEWQQFYFSTHTLTMQ